MNIFLYFKDHDYFASTVAPFVSNKMEKTFVDYWLLGDIASIEHFKSVDSNLFVFYSA